MQQAGFQQIDQPPDCQPEQRQDDDACEQLIGLHQVAGLQHEGADAEFGADHFRADQGGALNYLFFIEGKGLALELCFSIRVGCPEVPARE